MKYEIEMAPINGWEPDEWLYTDSDSTTQHFLGDDGKVHRSMDFDPMYRLVLRSTDTPMPDRLHRTLWGVVKPGIWIAKNNAGRWRLYDCKPSPKNFGFEVETGRTAWFAHEFFCIDFPDVPWNESLMMMPMDPPGDSELKAASKEVVFKHDGSWMCQEPKQSDVINRLRKAIG